MIIQRGTLKSAIDMKCPNCEATIKDKPYRELAALVRRIRDKQHCTHSDALARAEARGPWRLHCLECEEEYEIEPEAVIPEAPSTW